MPKMKSNRGAAKRFSLKKSGVIKHKRAGMRHHQSHKTKKQKKQLIKDAYVHPSNVRQIRQLLAAQ